jgi:hypothetical protein
LTNWRRHNEDQASCESHKLERILKKGVMLCKFTEFQLCNGTCF